ncbi:hypothetical protein Smp_171900 [Schistosoma mansoni]|uniref:hypothetical protein n=1 Tax=Schistosoma mansoni TaxID=6183 RepID=UPI00022DCBCA|nr:hypothetical protein Smp_171900 [Schistosoma mansoni]|eukprot:XP_018654261.1 hypothetical protein Smp_171900 [Schistosoma mansoni]
MALNGVKFLRLPIYLSNPHWPGLVFIRTYLLMIRRFRVNKQFAEKLIAEVPPIACKENITSCDGGGGALGHPKVYINLDQPGNHACGYVPMALNGVKFLRLPIYLRYRLYSTESATTGLVFIRTYLLMIRRFR